MERARLDKDNIKDRTRIDDNGCWIWTRALKKSIDGFNYGWLSFKGKQMAAHRASWMIHHGDIPDGMYVCHKCDIPSCVNPDHLFLGTASDNMLDMWNKKRHKPVTKGVIGSISAKLTLSQVIEIRKLLFEKKRQHEIAKIYNVSQGAISTIKTGKRWSRYA